VRADDILKKRRDRSIAIILGVKEREIDPLLDQEPGGRRASTLLRKVVLDQINDFCDLALDVANSGEAPKFEFNPDIWMRRIDGRLDELQGAVNDLNGNGHH
jgi:hypothetical protein